MRSLGHGLLLATLALAGCAGSPGDAGAPSSSGLVEVDADTSPLTWLLSDAWRTAPAGCEGRLAPEVTFKIASADDGLVAAVGGDGEIVCVDTVESVQEELESHGEEERADELGDQFLLAAGLAVPDLSGIDFGDPTPEPSVREIASGGFVPEPTPQPSVQPSRK